MLLLAKIVEVENQIHKTKSVAAVTLKTSNPSEAHVLMIWNNGVEKGEHLPFHQMVGEEVVIAVRAEIFNGKLQYSLNTGFKPLKFVDYIHLVESSRPAPVRQVAGQTK